MRDLKALALGLFLTLASFTGAVAQCGTQAPANKFCGNDTGSTALATYKSIPAGALTPIAGGTVLGNPTAALAVPVATAAPVLGIPGTSTGQIGLAGLTGGTAILRAQATAGSAVSLLPTVAGTLVASATAPLSIGAATGTIALATPLALNFGGTNANLTASNGGIVWSNATQMQILAGTATATQMLQSGATATPAWSTTTWPATSTINQLLYSSAANVISGLATANGGILNTGATGVPSVTPTPLIGVVNSVLGTIRLTGNTSGTVTITPQATAGAPTLTLPNASGTFAVSATAPIVLSATTGALTCPTCTTSAASLTANQLVIGSGSQGEQSLGTLGTTTTVLHGNAGGAPTFGAVSLTADITGTLGIGNGGTGQTTASAAIGALMPTPVRAGDVAYWNGSIWTTLAGNNSGTNVFTENASGVPSWAAAGAGTVTSVTCGTGLSGGTFTTTGTCALALTNATLQSGTLTPTGTTSASVMMGLGVTTCRLAPVYSTRMHVTIAGFASVSAVGTWTSGFRFGTGAGPANAAATTGTAVGTTQTGTSAVSGYTMNLVHPVILTGLTPGTTYWFDLTFGTNTGTGTIGGVACMADEF